MVENFLSVQEVMEEKAEFMKENMELKVKIDELQCRIYKQGIEIDQQQNGL